MEVKITRKRLARRYSRPVERGLGPDGGAWNLRQASTWSSIGEHTLRAMAKAGEIPCAYFIGRRIVLPRQGFINWFNARGTTTTVA
jgi:Helix-turn-helix domain